MIDPPEITTSEEQLVAYVHLVVMREQIRSALEPALVELKRTIAGQGIKASGPWLTHHLRIDPRVFDFRVCLPVGREVVAKGRVEAGRMDARKVARTIYRGAYEKLGGGWRELGMWMKQSGHRPEEDRWERYLAGPEKSTRPEEWETELNAPIA